MTMTSTPQKKTTKTRAKRKTTSPQKLPPNPFIFEILNLASKQRSKAKKAEILKEYETDSLKSLFIWNFDESVISMLPEGVVPYKKNEVPVGTDHTSLRREYKQLYNFVKGGNDSLSSLRRETMFIQILEVLHPEEADILCLCKDKKLQTKYNISFDVVKQAYPDIQWGGRS